MGNKELFRKSVDREFFLKVMREKGYTVEKLGENRLVDRSSKTIQRELSLGKMQPDLLDRIGRVLDVDPSFLAGDYIRRFEEIKHDLANPDLTYYLCTKTDRFPYYKHKLEEIDFNHFLEEIMLVNNISKSQYYSLNQKERRAFKFDIGLALHDVIKQYFEVDSQGIDTSASMPDGLVMIMSALSEEQQ